MDGDGTRTKLGRGGPGDPADLVGPLLLCSVLLTFPQMALGLSGFELEHDERALLVRGVMAATTPARPRGRIRNTRRMLIGAALLMSVFIVSSVLVVSLLVPEPRAARRGGRVAPGGCSLPCSRRRTGGRLVRRCGQPPIRPVVRPTLRSEHGSRSSFWPVPGAATVSLRDVVPHYLARFGMQLDWGYQISVVLQLFNLTILLVVRWCSAASVSAQQEAYAASVLVLMAEPRHWPRFWIEMRPAAGRGSRLRHLVRSCRSW